MLIEHMWYLCMLFLAGSGRYLFEGPGGTVWVSPPTTVGAIHAAKVARKGINACPIKGEGKTCWVV